MTRASYVGIRVLGWGTIFLLLMPIVYTFWVSFSPDSFLTPPSTAWSLRWYVEFAQDGRWLRAMGRSLTVAGFSAACSTALGLGVVLSHSRDRKKHIPWIDAAIALPAVVPAAALGLALLPFFHAARLFGTVSGMVLVHTVLTLPIAYMILSALEPRNLSQLREVAQGLGASARHVLFRVSIPLFLPAIVAAGVCGFILSMNESMVSIFIASPDNETLPTVIWPQLRNAPTPLVAVAACTTLGVCLALLIPLMHLYRNSNLMRDR